jgi:hypothetical protein
MRILPMRPRSIQRATKRLRIVIAAPCFRFSPKVLDSRDETVMRAGAALITERQARRQLPTYCYGKSSGAACNICSCVLGW